MYVSLSHSCGACCGACCGRSVLRSLVYPESSRLCVDPSSLSLSLSTHTHTHTHTRFYIPLCCATQVFTFQFAVLCGHFAVLFFNADRICKKKTKNKFELNLFEKNMKKKSQFRLSFGFAFSAPVVFKRLAWPAAVVSCPPSPDHPHNCCLHRPHNCCLHHPHTQLLPPAVASKTLTSVVPPLPPSPSHLLPPTVASITLTPLASITPTPVASPWSFTTLKHKPCDLNPQPSTLHPQS